MCSFSLLACEKAVNYATSSRGSASSKHRSEIVKRHRNNQRVFKVGSPEAVTGCEGVWLQELGTVLQVFDFGMSDKMAADVEDDRSCVLNSVDDSMDSFVDIPDIDADRIMAEIAADAMAQLELEPPSHQTEPWEENNLDALQEIVAQNGGRSQTGSCELKPHVSELLKKGEDATQNLRMLKSEIQESVWGTVCITAMCESIVIMNEIVGEMREYCPEYRSGSSWASASSTGSLCAQKDQTLLQLLRFLQELYDEVITCCALMLGLVEAWFRAEDNFGTLADVSFHHCLKMIRVLRQIKEFEVVMCCDGVGPAKVTKPRNMSQTMEQRLTTLIQTMNDVTMHVQASVLQKKYLKPEQEENGTDRSNHSEILQQCWEGLKEVTYRLASCCPGLKQQLFMSMLNTVTSAAGTIKSIQDSEESEA